MFNIFFFFIQSTQIGKFDAHLLIGGCPHNFFSISFMNYYFAMSEKNMMIQMSSIQECRTISF